MKRNVKIPAVQISICIFLLFILMSGGNSIFPSESDAGNNVTTPEEYQKGREYLAEVAEALGGVENFKGMKSQQSMARVVSIAPQGRRSAIIDRLEVFPDKWAVTVRQRTREFKRIFNGQTGWTEIGDRIIRMGDDEIAESKRDIYKNFNFILADPYSDAFTVAYKGSDDFAGQNVDRLDFVTIDDCRFSWFIDPETKFPVGRREFPCGPDSVTQILVLTNYKKFGEIFIATIAVSKSKYMETRMELLTMDINVDYDSSVFMLPDKLQK